MAQGPPSSEMTYFACGSGTGRVMWQGRSPELRLRPQVAPFVPEYLPLCPTRATADGRLAVTPRATESDTGQLGGVLIPISTRNDKDISVRRLEPLEAFSMLTTFPRLAGWHDERILRNQFDGVAGLVNAVPVVAARVPWGPPFEASPSENLLEAIVDASNQPL